MFPSGLTLALAILTAANVYADEEDCLWTAVRIVGKDHNAKEGGFPYMVSIQKYWNLDNGTTVLLPHCGGSIINENWSLTAAHCVYMTQKSKFLLVSGTINLKEEGVRHTIESIVVHRDYNPKNSNSDLALIKVQNRFEWSNNPLVRPIALNTNTWAEPQRGVISGWGLSGEDGKVQNDNLQYLEEKIISLSECQQEHSPIPIYVSYLCGRAEHCSGACGGDSGSPLVWNGVQYGVASWIRYPCGKHPDVYINVAHYIGWIKNTIMRNKSFSRF